LETSDQTSQVRGTAGPVFVRTVRHAHALTEAFVKSGVEAGFPFNPDYNGTSQEGIAYAQLTQRLGLRWSAADAFINPLLKKDNFALLPNAHVDRIECNRGVATGVWVTTSGQPPRLVSAGQIVICAGAINTPKLLMLSGIGDPALLREHNIKVVVDSPEVGQNLREHPVIRLVYKTRIPSNNLTEGVRQKLRIAGEFLIRRSGPVSAPIEAVAFLKTSAALSYPDIQLHFLTVGRDTSSGGGSAPLLTYPSVTIVVNKTHPKGRGRVLLSSANPAAPPRIECNLLGGGGEDLETLRDGVNLVRKIMSAPPVSDLVEREEIPGADYLSGQSLARYIETHTGIGFHPVGTCRMGPDSTAVVSPELRVNGIANLWIADASIMPDLISGNTNAACIMIGMKLGKKLAETKREHIRA
jgi:choline dehydrogenase